jgi:hypothetical protein
MVRGMDVEGRELLTMELDVIHDVEGRELLTMELDVCGLGRKRMDKQNEYRY